MGYIEDFIAAAEKDNREGDHSAIVMRVEDKVWPSGDAFKKIVVGLITANNAKADFNLQPIPDEKTLAAIKEEGNRGKMRGVANNIAMVRQLEKYYGKAPANLSEGDTLTVKTVKNKEGFVRVIAILPKGGAAKKVDSAETSTPF